MNSSECFGLTRYAGWLSNLIVTATFVLSLFKMLPRGSVHQQDGKNLLSSVLNL